MPRTTGSKTESPVNIGGELSNSSPSVGDRNFSALTRPGWVDQQRAVAAALVEVTAAVIRLGGPHRALPTYKSKATNDERANIPGGARLKMALEVAKKTAELDGSITERGRLATSAA